MSDRHDGLHPDDDRRNQSSNATGGTAEKLTNHVMGVTARPRIQPISERFRSGNGQEALDTTTPAGKAMFQMMGVFADFAGTSPRNARDALKPSSIYQVEVASIANGPDYFRRR
jgi:hypothetical protein